MKKKKTTTTQIKSNQITILIYFGALAKYEFVSPPIGYGLISITEP